MTSGLNQIKVTPEGLGERTMSIIRQAVLDVCRSFQIDADNVWDLVKGRAKEETRLQDSSNPGVIYTRLFDQDSLHGLIEEQVGMGVEATGFRATLFNKVESLLGGLPDRLEILRRCERD